MIRSIDISTEVYAAIWSNRIKGEETENEILSRLLECVQSVESGREAKNQNSGLFDSRNNVLFPEGFEIFRNYKGKEYKAIIKNERWLNLGNQKTFPTINQLNKSLPVGSENAWIVWKYKTPSGSIQRIDTLRQ